MKKLTDALRDEITRVARKEVKAQVTSLKSASAAYRREIAELKRVVRRLERRLEYVERQERRRAEKAPPKKLAEGARFSAKGLRSHREKLGLSAADYGLLAGLSAQTIYSYERGESKPRPAQLAKLVAMRNLGTREAERRLAVLKG
ncbi:MAG TPA: helix-turn-helix transcriptional regulator [Longimicrobiales bacterium]|nr:helix-turn-helix transcriptional regulator [Longimicrobiales bacterium]